MEEYGRILVPLIFGIKALIPVEISSPSQRNLKFHAIENERLLREDLMFRENIWDVAVKRDEAYKRAAARYHNLRVRLSGIQKGD